MSGEVAVRPFRHDDAAAWVALVRRVEPVIVQTPRGLLHVVETIPARARNRFWTAWSDGELVGVALGRLAWWTDRDDLAYLWVGVAPHARGRGIGARLYALAEDHLRDHGARRVETWTNGDEAGERFAAARAFEPVRTARMWSVDPRAVDVGAVARLERERAGDGFRVVALRTVRGDEGGLHALYAEAAADEPSDEPEVVRFDEWKRNVLEHPDLSLDGSAVVLHGERPVSLAWIGVDREGGRASHWFTGTLRAYRRRGLARLAKLAAIRWAAQNGITALSTGNDATNADMLALNEHLGYRPRTTGTRHAKDL